MNDSAATIDDFSLDAHVVEQLRAYCEAVRSSPHNLLSRRGLEELETRHVPESIAFALGLAWGPAAVLDLGTGGGLPGLVIAVVRPDLAVTLLDATTKKIRFVEQTASALGVEVETLNGRADELAGDHGGSFDMVVARAVAPLATLLEWSLPFLRPGGVLHAIKGEQWPRELREALPIIQQRGAQVVGVPSTDGHDQLPPAAPRVVSIAARQ